jgi:hypothetical protein
MSTGLFSRVRPTLLAVLRGIFMAVKCN